MRKGLEIGSGSNISLMGIRVHIDLKQISADSARRQIFIGHICKERWHSVGCVVNITMIVFKMSGRLTIINYFRQ